MSVDRHWISGIQLAVRSSRPEVNSGMPFLYQHKVMVGLHLPCVVIGSTTPTEMKGPQVSVLESWATEIYHDTVEKAWQYLKELAKPLCSQVRATALPPFCAINHEIPLIDEQKIYHWRPKDWSLGSYSCWQHLPHGERNKNTRKLSSPMPQSPLQALMNYIFEEYIGSFMDVYLDNIIMKEKLYLVLSRPGF